MVGIYKITSPSGKVYIGQSINIEKRWRRYSQIKKREQQRKLESSILKYGYDAHIFEVVHEIEGEYLLSDLTKYEQLYIDFYKYRGVDLLNMCMIAERPPLSVPGVHRKWSDEARKRQSELYKGRPSGRKGMKYNYSEDGKERLRKAHANKVISEAHKEKIREAGRKRKGEKKDPEHIRKLQEGRRKWIPTDEYCRKMAVNSANRVWSEESKKKISDSKKGIPRSPEVIAKVKAGVIAYYERIRQLKQK